jgi:hypothetical protein
MRRTTNHHGPVAALLIAGSAGWACAPGCAGVGRAPAVITSNDPASKIPAIKQAVDARESETAPQLVRSLASEDPAVRFYAIRGLLTLTGETFGYVWYADDAERAAAVQKWKLWLDGEGGRGLAGGDMERK